MEWFKFRMQWQRPMMKLSDEDAGKVIKALLAYVATGEETETDTPGDILLCSLFEQLEGDLEAFREKAEQKEGIREKRRAAGRRSGEVRRAKAGRAQQGPSVDPVCPDESENDPVCSDVLPDEPVCPDMPPDVSQSDPVCSDLPGKVLESVPVRSDLFVPNKNTEPRNTEPRSKNTEPGISETETERETDTEGENTSFCSELLTEASEQPLSAAGAWPTRHAERRRAASGGLSTPGSGGLRIRAGEGKNCRRRIPSWSMPGEKQRQKGYLTGRRMPGRIGSLYCRAGQEMV